MTKTVYRRDVHELVNQSETSWYDCIVILKFSLIDASTQLIRPGQC